VALSQVETDIQHGHAAQATSILTAAQRRTGILCLLLIAVTLAFYNPIVCNRFVDYDDAAYIVQNRYIQMGLTWRTVKWSFTTFREGNWHPLTWLSHAVDFQLFHVNPIGHHYTNLLLHATNAVLLFLLLRRATGFKWQSLMVAALFALHPVNVESVAWAAERKNVLSMLFFLLALLAYHSYSRRLRLVLYGAVALSFALGLMAKPQIVTLPFVLLLWDYWPLDRISALASRPGGAAAPPRSFWFLVWEKTPLFALAAADSLVTVVAQRSGNTVRSLSEVSLSARLENAFVSYVRYLENALWPSHLAPLYPRLENSLAPTQVLGAIATLLMISVLVIRYRDRRYLVVGWLWFLGTLVPMIGFITVGEQALADRYAYLPFIGLFIAFVWGAGDLASRHKIRPQRLAASALVLLAVLGGLTYRQIAHWFDEETLWRYTLTVTQKNYVAHNNLALALAKTGRGDEAVVHFEAARALHHYPPDQIVKLAVYELRLGLPQEALMECTAALQATSDPRVQEVALSEKGLALLQLRRYEEALASFRDALRLRPENGDALFGSGLLALRSKDSDLAIAQFAQAARVSPSALNLLLLAQALRQNGRNSEADVVAAQAGKISSNLDQDQKDLANFLAMVGVKPV
jgi:protein O-mannosyl-transferase